ncbi:MAG: hypothetical protein J6Z46_02720 [Lachnospiraceae bacterium]|nr:hypothetical protein [Lachnospiraceae bacterium]
MQTIYLPAHLWFIFRLIKWRTPSPVSRWFIVLVFGLWGIVFGSFTETMLLLFCKNNVIYTFGVSYQLVSTLAATMAFLIWNLYVAGNVTIVENKAFRVLIYIISLFVALTVATDRLHHLFYEKLVLGEPVIHGKLFIPCVLVVYGMLFSGWIISLVHIMKNGEDKLKRALIFSMYPLLPGLANLIRSLTGFTLIDVNPVVMTVCIFCLYSMVFKDRYVSIMPASIEQALEQTESIVFMADKDTGKITYANKAAREQYADAVKGMTGTLKTSGGQLETSFGGKFFKVNVSDMQDDLLVTATDVSEIKKQQETLLSQIKESTGILADLEEKKRNIDAYIDFLYKIPNLKEKWEMFSATEEESKEAFRRMESNLKAALDKEKGSETLLNENLLISEKTIGKIREAVALLREDM